MTRRRAPKVKKRKAQLPFHCVVDVVADGSIANGQVAEGAQVPVLVLDASQRQDIHDVFAAHRYGHLNYGDVRTIWAGDPKNWIALDILFDRPVETRVIIRLPMPKYALLVHLALKAKAVHIHAGRPGSRFADYYHPSKSINRGLESDAGSILLTLPPGGFEKLWGGMYRAQLAKYFKKTRKCSTAQARDMANEALSNIDKFASVRIPRGPATGKMLYVEAGGEGEPPKSGLSDEPSAPRTQS